MEVESLELRLQLLISWPKSFPLKKTSNIQACSDAISPSVGQLLRPHSHFPGQDFIHDNVTS